MESKEQKEATLDQAKKLGLREDEFELIKEALGRTPNHTEISIYSVMWSEDCSNKNTFKELDKLPKTNRSHIELDEGLSCAIKISEDVSSQKRPLPLDVNQLAQLNAFYFGSIEEEVTTRDIKTNLKNIDLSNPIVGNKLFFDAYYNSNPVVRQFSIGVFESENSIPSKASGPGSTVFLTDIDQNQEKELKKALADLAKSGTLVGGLDIGCGGVAGTSSQMSLSGGVGMDIWIDKFTKEQKSTAILTAPSNGMLLVIEKDKEQSLKDLFSKRGIKFQQIGVVTDNTKIKFYNNDSKVAEIPYKSLLRGEGAPQYERESEEPAYYEKLKEFEIDDVAYPDDLKEIALFLLKHQNITSRKWVDNQLNSKTIEQKSTSGATSIKLAKIKRELIASLASNPRYVFANPQLGTAMIFAEAAREIICSGGNPIAISYNSNFGNLYNPEHYWQFSEAIKGLSKVCSRFKTPVLNESITFNKEAENGSPFFPTPTIGMIGIAEKTNIMSPDFKYKGDLIFILGENKEDLGCSEYLISYQNIKSSPTPYFNLEKEFELQETVKQLIKTKYINAAHSVSKGGLFIALSEMGMINELGFDIVTDAEIREDAFLFGEAAGRVIVTVTEDFEDEFIEYMMNSNTQFTLLGHVTKGKMVIDDEHFGFIKEAKDIYENALERLIEK